MLIINSPFDTDRRTTRCARIVDWAHNLLELLINDDAQIIYISIGNSSSSAFCLRQNQIFNIFKKHRKKLTERMFQMYLNLRKQKGARWLLLLWKKILRWTPFKGRKTISTTPWVWYFCHNDVVVWTSLDIFSDKNSGRILYLSLTDWLTLTDWMTHSDWLIMN